MIFKKIPQQVILTAKPSTPAAGHTKIYQRTDGNWYSINAAGTETLIVNVPSPAIIKATASASQGSAHIPDIENLPQSNLFFSSNGAPLNLTNLNGGTNTHNVVMQSGTFASSNLVTMQNCILLGRDVLGTFNGTTAQNAILIGYRAGYQAGANPFNAIFIGHQAGQSVSNPTRCIGIGNNVLESNTQQEIIAIGPNAGRFNKGLQNIFIGPSVWSGSAVNKTGIQNVIMGALIGQQATTAARNTLIGSQAGQNITSASDNTLIGRHALQPLSTGSGNTALGSSAGKTAAVFNQCLFLGAGAHFGQNSAAVLQNNIAVIGGEIAPTHKLFLGNGVQTANSQHNGDMLIRPSHMEPGVAINIAKGTNFIFEAGEGKDGTGHNAGDLVFRVGDMATSTGSGVLTTYIDAWKILGDEGLTGRLLGAGGAFSDGATWTDASDERLKKDIKDEIRGLEIVKSLKPKMFQYKRKPGMQIGFIAQEVQTVLPEVVNSDGKYLGVNYGAMNAVLVNAIKELSNKNDELEKRIAKLEG